jgi:serine-type D-Ala-D-Ala carboxypeptidase (penicillin-binding protein 5/6)
LSAGDSGQRFVVGPDDVMDTETRRREGRSIVEVRAGEQFTEREALMASLSPSANNIAVLVARQVSGSVAAFVAEMNRTARALAAVRGSSAPARAYRRHIENQIRAGNTPLS